MDNLTIPLWVILGAGTAVIFLKSQWWSVMAIRPEKPHSSKWLIIGGTIIRLVFIALILITAGFYSIYALLIVFSSFMVSRLLLLLIWQKRFEAENEKSH
jgi:hypothetical protein